MDSDAALERAVADLFPVEVAWVSTEAEASQIEAGREALASSQVVAVVGEGVPQLAASGLDGEACIMAVPLVGSRVLFVARGAPNEFTVTEMARARALASILEAHAARLEK
jgi:hypothetical protein